MSRRHTPNNNSYNNSSNPKNRQQSQMDATQFSIEFAADVMQTDEFMEDDSDFDDLLDSDELDESDEDLIEFYGGIDALDDSDDLSDDDDDELDADADYIAQLLKSEELGDLDEFTIVDELGFQHQVSANEIIGANNFTRKSRMPSNPSQTENRMRKPKKPYRLPDQPASFDTKGLSKKQIKKMKIKEKRARRREDKDARAQKCTFDDVLKFNQQLQDFVRSADDSFGFPPLTRKRRYILHRLAGFYKLKSASFGTGSGRYTMCYRSSETYLPTQEAISGFLSAFQQEYNMNQFGGNREPVQPPRSYQSPSKPDPQFSPSRASPKQQGGRTGKNKHQNPPRRPSYNNNNNNNNNNQYHQSARSLGSNDTRSFQQHPRNQNQTGKKNPHRQTEPTTFQPRLRQEQPIEPASASLGSENAGYQILLSMGWQGGGLGVNETGMQGPLPVYIKMDRKGLGC